MMRKARKDAKIAMNILIADDHALLRKGLIQILADEYPAAHFGESSTTPETLDCLSQSPWDLLILDIFMPGRSGLEVLSEVKRLHAKVPVLVLSSAPEDQMAVRVLKAGASGYLNKQTAPEDLVRAVGKILAGGRFISSRVAELLSLEIGQDVSLHDKLSDREFAVLQLLGDGKTVTEIASVLSLSPKTVSTYHTRIWEKLRVKNDVEMVRYAIRHGIDKQKE
jgi:two-component system, NarL family, invasion response regulator UvrY